MFLFYGFSFYESEKKCFPVKLISKFYKSKTKQNKQTENPQYFQLKILYKSKKSIYSFSACSLTMLFVFIIGRELSYLL